MRKILIHSLILLLSSQAWALPQCQSIRFSDVGWTDISINTALASLLLEGLGYQTKTHPLSVPVTYASLKNQDIDLFLGNWMPTMSEDIKPYQRDGSVETLTKILTEARYTLAVPSYVQSAGVKSIEDLHRFKDRFKGKIFAVEPGNDGNRLIQKMIDENYASLKGWKLIESSEQAMLMEVYRSVKNQEWVVFLGWEPHPMNQKIALKFLTGGVQYFGKKQGQSTVFINTRKNFSKDCPQVTQLLKNLKLSLDVENTLMSMVLDQNLEPKQAVKKWVKEHPKALTQWLKGVQTRDGKDGITAVQTYLNL